MYASDDEHLLAMLQRRGDGVVGLHRVPYAAWRAAPVEVQRFLALAFRPLLVGGRPPDTFGDSLLCFIPKAAGAIEMGHRRLQLRPLSLSNIGNKIASLFLNDALRTVAARGCHPMLFGFIEGRQLGDAVLLLEASAVRGIWRSHASGTTCTDFTAACPSMLHRWICQVMFDLWIPTTVILARMASCACT